MRDQISVATRKDSGHLPFTWRMENPMVRSRHSVLEASENMGNTFQAVLSRQSNPVNTDTEGAKSVHILIRDVRTKRVDKDFKQRLRNGLVR